MATYEYKCETDSTTETVQRSMKDEEVLPVCTICNEPMRRVYYAAPVKFNAEGFYSTGG